MGIPILRQEAGGYCTEHQLIISASTELEDHFQNNEVPTQIAWNAEKGTKGIYN